MDFTACLACASEGCYISVVRQVKSCIYWPQHYNDHDFLTKKMQQKFKIMPIKTVFAIRKQMSTPKRATCDEDWKIYHRFGFSKGTSLKSDLEFGLLNRPTFMGGFLTAKVVLKAVKDKNELKINLVRGVLCFTV